MKSSEVTDHPESEASFARLVKAATYYYKLRPVLEN